MVRYEEGVGTTLNVNVTQTKKCALCTHWYDPSNAHIQSKSARINVWSIDGDASCYCEIKKHDMKGRMFCSEFALKNL